MPENNRIQEITLDEVLEIRHSILRFAESPQESILPGDNDAKTRHFGCFVAGNLAGVASLFIENLADRPNIGNRLRAMAVLELMQRQGVGTALIEATIHASSVANSDYLWCTVRPNALDFYTRFGFRKDNIQIEMAHGTFSRMILALPGSHREVVESGMS